MSPSKPHPAVIPFLIGTYAGEQAESIHHCALHTETGTLERTGGYKAGANPSFLAWHPSSAFLYAVNELNEGCVSVYRFNRTAGTLPLINRQPSHGMHPCHLCTDRSGRLLFAANYSSGTLAMYPVASDGTIGAASHIVQHAGHGPDPRRQKGPHAHMVVTDPSDRFLLACDLGLDSVIVYEIDRAAGKLTARGKAMGPAGAGPRHLAFCADGKTVCVINELDPSVTFMAWDAAGGTLTARDTAGLRYGDGQAMPSGAEICVHPRTGLLYCSVRGFDAIVVCEVAGGGTAVKYRSHVSCGGRSPRHISIEPAGRYLLASNQESGNVVCFAIDRSTGALEKRGELIVREPVCVVYCL